MLPLPSPWGNTCVTVPREERGSHTHRTLIWGPSGDVAAWEPPLGLEAGSGQIPAGILLPQPQTQAAIGAPMLSAPVSHSPPAPQPGFAISFLSSCMNISPHKTHPPAARTTHLSPCPPRNGHSTLLPPQLLPTLPCGSHNAQWGQWLGRGATEGLPRAEAGWGRH